MTDVNQARQQVFAQSSRSFEYLPPTKAALIEHVLCAQLDADAQDTVMGAPLLIRLQTNNIAVM